MKDLIFDKEFSQTMRINLEIIRDSIISLEEGVSNRPTFSEGQGAPGGGVTTKLYLDTQNDRLYVDVDGTYKYAGLV